MDNAVEYEGMALLIEDEGELEDDTNVANL